MGYGHLYAPQQTALKPVLEGKTVLDLGSGDLILSHMLVELGAAKVVAIDKDHDYSERRYRHTDPVSGFSEIRDVHERVEARTESFRSLAASLKMAKFTAWVSGSATSVSDWPEIAFLSWPLNCDDPHRDEIVRSTPIVAYLGKNTGGVACGSADLFVDLCHRELLAHVPARSGVKGNTLIVVGRPLPEPREPVAEEIAAISGCDLPSEPQGSRWDAACILARRRVGLLSLEGALEALALGAERFSVDDLTHLVEVAHEMEDFEVALAKVIARPDVPRQVRKAAQVRRKVLGPLIAERSALRRRLSQYGFSTR